MTSANLGPDEHRFTLAFGDGARSLCLKPGRVLSPPASVAATPPTWDYLVDRLLADLAPPGRATVLVPDRTRDAGTARFLSSLRARLPHAHLCVLFASGTHTPMGDDEMRAVAGPAADSERVELVAHDCDGAELEDLGPDAAGRPVRVHRRAVDTELLIVLSSMSFHYLAGFGGGRKMILPGVADRATATRVHAACLDDGGRPPGVRAGRLLDNPFHLGIEARLRGRLPPTRAVCVVIEGGALKDGEAGELFAHHEALALRFARARRVEVARRVRRLVVSAGGAPYDRDVVQAHKALNAVSDVVLPGGRIVLVAELARGLGHDAFLAWVEAGPADAQHRALARDFHIGRQTAWSWRRLVETYRVGVVSRLSDEAVRALGAEPLDDHDAVTRFLGEGDDDIGVAPDGARFIYEPRAPMG